MLVYTDLVEANRCSTTIAEFGGRYFITTSQCVYVDDYVGSTILLNTCMLADPHVYCTTLSYSTTNRGIEVEGTGFAHLVKSSFVISIHHVLILVSSDTQPVSQVEVLSTDIALSEITACMYFASLLRHSDF